MLGTSLETKGGIASVIRSYKKSGLMEECNIKYISTHTDGSKLFKLLIACRAYVQFITSLIYKQVTVVHIHSASCNSFYRKTGFIIIAKLFRKKIIFHLHGGGFRDIFYDKAPNIIQKIIVSVINSVDVVIVLSDRWKRQMREILGEQTSIKVVYNSVMAPKGVSAKKLSSTPVIVFLGLVCKEKGVRELMSSSSLLYEKVAHKLKIAGDGEIEYFQELAIKKKIDKYTEFLGWINSEEKKILLKEASVLVLPSYNEGLPMCILEALSYGVPVIATSVGGIPDVISNGSNGFIIATGDYKSLADKLFKLLTDEALYLRMSKNSMATINDSFNVEITKQQLKNIYANFEQPLTKCNGD